MEVPKFVEYVFLPLYRDKDFLHQKYAIEGCSAKEISCLISSSRSVVMKYLKQYAIPIRPDDQKKKSQIGYGEAWRDRQVVAHKKEQDLIDKMSKLREEGLSYWKVADVLNAWGIPTKTRKGKWSSKQVHQILVRVNHQEPSVVLDLDDGLNLGPEPATCQARHKQSGEANPAEG